MAQRGSGGGGYLAGAGAGVGWRFFIQANWIIIRTWLMDQ